MMAISPSNIQQRGCGFRQKLDIFIPIYHHIIIYIYIYHNDPYWWMVINPLINIIQPALYETSYGI